MGVSSGAMKVGQLQLFAKIGWLQTWLFLFLFEHVCFLINSLGELPWS